MKQFSALPPVMLMLASTHASAIVNVEQAIIGKSADGIHASASLMSGSAGGNTDKSAAKADALAIWQHDGQVQFAQMQYAYGKSRGVTDTDRFFVHLRHRSDLDSGMGAEAFAQTGRDRFARLSQRTLLGFGLRYSLFEEPGKAAGYLGLGAFHEHELLNARAGTFDELESRFWRGNSYLIFKRQFSPQLRFNNTLYYQPALQDTADYRLLEQATLLIKLADKLDFKISLDYAYDSKPPETVKKYDMQYSTGLEYSF